MNWTYQERIVSTTMIFTSDIIIQLMMIFTLIGLGFAIFSMIKLGIEMYRHFKRKNSMNE